MLVNFKIWILFIKLQDILQPISQDYENFQDVCTFNTFQHTKLWQKDILPLVACISYYM